MAVIALDWTGLMRAKPRSPGNQGKISFVDFIWRRLRITWVSVIFFADTHVTSITMSDFFFFLIFFSVGEFRNLFRALLTQQQQQQQLEQLNLDPQKTQRH